MASMCDVPDVTRNKMSLRSCHKLQKNALFAFKKGNIAPFSRKSLIVFHEISNTSRGPTPGEPTQERTRREPGEPQNLSQKSSSGQQVFFYKLTNVESRSKEP